MRHPLKQLKGGQGDPHSCDVQLLSENTSRNGPSRDSFLNILDEVRERHEFRLIGSL